MSGVSSMARPGILAVWNNVRRGDEADFDAWYQTEHLHERLGIPGFRLGRRWEAVTGGPAFFACYVVDSPAVLSSPAYLERLNHPTPWTRRIMSGVFLDMIRTVCTLAATGGVMRGSFCVTARFDAPVDVPQLVAMLQAWPPDAGIARWEVWEAEPPPAEISEEEKLRGGDRRIAACIVVETPRLADAERIRDRLDPVVTGAGGTADIYRLLCMIEGRTGAR